MIHINLTQDEAVLLFVVCFCAAVWYYCKQIIVDHFRSVVRRDEEEGGNL